jgi:hypothetical protein
MERMERQFAAAHLSLEAVRKRAKFRAALNASDAPDAVKTLIGAVVDPIGFVVDQMQRAVKRVCPHCLANGISASLRSTTTARGEVQRCWQCGGEYRDGKRVWPEAS